MSRTLSVSALAATLVLAAGFVFPATTFASTTAGIVINEFSSHTDPEWVELYNASSTPIDISGWKVEDPASHSLTVASSTTIAAGDFYLLMGTTGDTFMNQSGDTLTLVDASTTIQDSVTYGSGGDVAAPTSGQSAIRTNDGGSEWAVTDAPTPGISNGNFTNFNSFNLGSVNGQGGWTETNSSVDQAVVSTSQYSWLHGFGPKALRISNAYTNGGFDWVYANPLVNSVGEASSTDGTFSAGQKQTHYELSFNIASASSTEQTGLQASVSPDRGDGSRMSYLRFEDQSDGIHVYFDDVLTSTNSANWTETDIATLSRTSAHSIKMTIDTVDGKGNDVVNVYIDGVLKATGTTWENYYWYDTEASAEQTSRIMKTVIFQARSGYGTATNTAGYGFLFDDVQLSASTPVTAPAFTSSAVTSGMEGSAYSYGVTTSSSASTITASGLPSGITLTDNGNGTASLSGTPTTPGSYNVKLTAYNTAGSDTQSFTLVVEPNEAFVSTTGSDSNSGTEASPVATIAHALTLINPNGRIFLEGGTFTESPTIDKAATLENASTTASSTVVGLITVGSNDVTVSGLEIENPGGTMGIYVPHYDSVTITGNTLHDIGGSGVSGAVQAINVHEGSSDITVSGNTIYNVTSAGYVDSSHTYSAKGIYFGDSSGSTAIASSTIADNTIYSVVSASTTPGGRWGAYGILINRESTDLKVTGNKIHDLEGLWAHAIGLEGNTPGAVVSNNEVSNLVDHKTPSDAVALQLEDNPGAMSVTGSGNTYNNVPMTLNTSAAYVDPTITGYSSSRFPEVFENGTYYYAGLNAFSTIQSAVSGVSSGGTVHVAAGTYDESVVIDQPLTLAGAGPDATILDSNSLYMVSVQADNVTISGLAITSPLYNGTGDASGIVDSVAGVQSNLHITNVKIHDIGNPNRPPSIGTQGINIGPIDGVEIDHSEIYNIIDNNAGSAAFGITMWGNSPGDVKNVNVHDNVIHDITNPSYVMGIMSYMVNNGTIQDNKISAVTGSARAEGIQIVGSTDVTANHNTVTGPFNSAGIYASSNMVGPVTITNNTVTGASAVGIKLASPFAMTVTGNTVSGATVGIQVNSTATIAPTVNSNSISGDTTGLNNLSANSVDATKNWWGDATGPTIASNTHGAGDSITGDATYAPWYADAAMTTLRYPTTSSDGEASTTISDDTTLTSTTTSVTVTIPAGTTVTGTSTWDGSITAPTATSTALMVPGYAASTTMAIEVGSSQTDLTFDKGVRLFFAGQAGTHVGWRNHDGTFTEITATCASDSQTAGDALPAGGDCKVGASSDLVVWTKHFSTFYTYSASLLPPTISPNGSVFHGSVSVTMDDQGGSTNIRYSTDGIDPECVGSGTSHGNTYSGTLTFSNSTTLKAMRCDTVAHLSSSIASATFSPSSGGSSSGGGGGGSSAATPATPASSNGAGTPATPATPATPSSNAGGQVLGAEAYNFTTDLHKGSSGTDVTELQKLLIAEGFDIPALTKGGVAYGYFGGQTLAAVIAYQKANGISPTSGYVGPLTRTQLNKGVIATTPEHATNLTTAQANSIIAILESFGADPAVVAKVKASLGL